MINEVATRERLFWQNIVVDISSYSHASPIGLSNKAQERNRPFLIELPLHNQPNPTKNFLCQNVKIFKESPKENGLWNGLEKKL